MKTIDAYDFIFLTRLMMTIDDDTSLLRTTTLALAWARFKVGEGLAYGNWGHLAKIDYAQRANNLYSIIDCLSLLDDYASSFVRTGTGKRINHIVIHHACIKNKELARLHRSFW